MKHSRKFIRRLLIVIAIACLIAAAVLIVSSILDARNSEQVVDSLRPDISQEIPLPSLEDDTSASSEEDTQLPSSPQPTAETTPEATPTPEPTPEPTPTPVPNPYADAFLANEDMAAWLTIPGMKIDYPVMWTPRDEEYYLRKDFYGNKDSNGCLLLDTDSCLDPLTTNLIIHGHNMKSGAMFGTLTDYEKESFYNDHRQIILHTETGQHNYEVISVFRSQVYRKSDTVFKFYKFFQANTEEEFLDFYNNIKEMSIYDTGVTAEFGDHFITLSTCVYHVENGRFVVVAKEVDPGDTYLPLESSGTN